MEILTGLSEAGRAILGRDFYSLDEVNQVFVVQPKNAVKPLFSLELELEQARKRGEFLIHRTDKAPDGTPLTMCRMVQILQEKFDKKQWGRILYNRTWYQDEPFFREATPRQGLALVSKALIPGSKGKNYWLQTDGLANLLRQIYQGREIPSSYQDVLKEWEKEKAGLEKILYSNWREAAKGLANLQINQELRQRPVEALYDVLIPFLTIRERRLVDVDTWTNALSSDGRLVNFGFFVPGGACVYRWRPDYDYPNVGVCSNRRII